MVIIYTTCYTISKLRILPTEFLNSLYIPQMKNISLNSIKRHVSIAET
jgi:hypothetical protein